MLFFSELYFCYFKIIYYSIIPLFYHSIILLICYREATPPIVPCLATTGGTSASIIQQRWCHCYHTTVSNWAPTAAPHPHCPPLQPRLCAVFSRPQLQSCCHSLFCHRPRPAAPPQCRVCGISGNAGVNLPPRRQTLISISATIRIKRHQ